MDLLFLCLQTVSGAFVSHGTVATTQGTFPSRNLPEEETFLFYSHPLGNQRAGGERVPSAFARADTKLFPRLWQARNRVEGVTPNGRITVSCVCSSSPPRIVVFLFCFRTSAALGVNPPPQPVGFPFVFFKRLWFMNFSIDQMAKTLVFFLF